MSVAYTKTLICLANSRKTTGRCIAGIEIRESGLGNWVRPVSSRPSGELSEEDRRFENGKDPKILDVIRVPMKNPSNHEFQNENHTIDDRYYWSLERESNIAEIEPMIIDQNTTPWKQGESSYNGTNDRIRITEIPKIKHSLRLIRVEDLTICIAVEGAEFGNGKRKVRGQFSHSGRPYLLSVTDPIIERQYFAGTNGNFLIGEAVLCLSLGEPYQGYIYKLIAAVIL